MIIINDCLIEATQDITKAYILGKVLFCLGRDGTYQATEMARELKFKDYHPITKRFKELQNDGWFIYQGTKYRNEKGQWYNTTKFYPTEKLNELKKIWEKENKNFKKEKGHTKAKQENKPKEEITPQATKFAPRKQKIIKD